jgi:hypothetical protein
MEPLKIFISYAKEDIDQVRPIYDTLKNAGYDPWLDEKKISAGQDWKHEINNAIEQSSFFLACLSGKSVDKTGFVQKELKMALEILDQQPEGRIYLIPVRLDECEVPMRLQGLHWCDLFEDDGMQDLLKAIERGALERGLVWLSAAVLNGPDQGKKFKCPSPGITIGRSPSNAIHLSDAKVSTLHARIEQRRKKVVFFHLSEKNPSIVQGEKRAITMEIPNKKEYLHDGDIITIGETQLMISIKDINIQGITTTEDL